MQIANKRLEPLWLLCTFSILSCTISAASTLHFNETALAGLLQQCNCLNLQLHSDMNNVNNTVIEYLLRQTHCPRQLSVIGATMSVGTNCKHHARVLHSTELSSVFAAPEMMKRGIRLFLILLDEPVQSQLYALALALWQKRGIYDVFYISANRSVFFNPFALSGQMNSNGIRSFGQFISIDEGNFHDLLYNINGYHFNGYPLRTYIFNSVYSGVRMDADGERVESIFGADSKVATLLSQRFNFSMQLQQPDDQFFGARLANGSFDGAIGRLIRYETDVVFTGFFVKDYRTRDIEFTVSVYTDELCCYVRKAARVPPSILPLFAVNIDVWSSFFAVGLGCPFIWMLLRFVSQRLRINGKSGSDALQPIRIFIDTWVVWVRVNVGVFPPSHAERIFVISLCLVSVIFGALFESSLATVYIRPLYYPDINTLQELEKARYRIYIKHAAMKDDLFFGHDSPVYRHLDERVILVAELEDRLINMMSKLGGFTAVTRASSLLLDDIYYVITKKVHMIPECPKHYHIAFVLPKHSPFEEHFNAFLLDCLQAGLIDRWVEQMKHAAKISIHRFSDYFDESIDTWKVFTLKDLQLAFYALFLGSLLSTCVFIFELIRNMRCVHNLRAKICGKIIFKAFPLTSR